MTRTRALEIAAEGLQNLAAMARGDLDAMQQVADLHTIQSGWDRVNEIEAAYFVIKDALRAAQREEREHGEI